MIGLIRRLHPPVTHNDPKATALLEQLGARRLEPGRALRGHDFFPSRRELAMVPSIQQARSQAPAQRVLQVHYFTDYCHWYVAGFDRRTGQAYGYTEEPGIDLHAWGSFDLNAMCSILIACQPPVIVRRDLDWKPRPAHLVIRPDRLAG
jgi:hypothetical protein